MALCSIALLALVALHAANPVKRADLEHDDPIGSYVGSKLTEAPNVEKREDLEHDDPIGSYVGSRLTPAPTANSKLRSVLLALAKKDTESPKNQDSGDYLDNPRSAANMMMALARRADAVNDTDVDMAEEDADWCKHEGVDLRYRGGFGAQADECPASKDVASTSQCASWRGVGYCTETYVDYMRANCEKTCCVGSFSTLTLAKTACSKYIECTGVTKYGTTNFRLMTLKPGSDWIYNKDTSSTSWTKCQGNGYGKQMEGLIGTLDTTLAARLEDVNSLKEMASFSADNTNSLQLLQLDLLKKVKAQGEELWPVNLDCSDVTVNWILNDITALQTLTLSGAPLDGKWKEAVLNLAKLIKLDGEAKSGMKLKLAVGCALTFAEPVSDYADYTGERTIDMASRYQSYVKWSEEGVLLDDFKTLNAWQYRYVVGAWRQDSELVWARENVLKGFGTRDKIGEATHSMIAYTLFNKFGVSVQSFADYYADNVTDASTGESKLVYRDVTMALVVEVGSVCGGISKFGVDMAQAFGLPAMPVAQPGHCAFIWYKNGNLALSNDISGWAGSTNHDGIAAAWVGLPKLGRAAWYPLMDAAQKNDKFWLTQKMVLATRYKSDMGLKFAILEKMTEWCPQNWGVWMDLIETLKDKDLIKDASDSFLEPIAKIRKDVATVSNLAPLSSVTASKSGDSVNNINDLTGSTTWMSKETTAWVEIDLQGVCDISSVEIQWWGCSIASDYDIMIQGPDNKEWTKVLSEEDAASSPAFNGWSKLTKGWSQDTTKIRLELREGKMDYWGYKAYFGIRRLVVNGVKYDDNVVIAQSKDIGSGGDIDLVDICALGSIEVTGSGTVTVSSSTDGVSYSVIGSGEVKGEASIALSGIATNVRLAVEGGEVSEVSLKGVRYTVNDLLKIQAKEDLADNVPVYSEIMKRIDEA